MFSFSSVIRKYVTEPLWAVAFNDKLITNIVGKWYLTLANHEIVIATGSDYQALLTGVFSSSDENKKFAKGEFVYFT